MSNPLLFIMNAVFFLFCSLACMKHTGVLSPSFPRLNVRKIKCYEIPLQYFCDALLDSVTLKKMYIFSIYSTQETSCRIELP